MVGLREEFIDHPDPRTDHFDVRMPVERPKHNYDRDPVEPLDSRALSFELRRPAIPLPPSTDGSGTDASFDIRKCLDDPMFADVESLWMFKSGMRSFSAAKKPFRQFWILL